MGSSENTEIASFVVCGCFPVLRLYNGDNKLDPTFRLSFQKTEIQLQRIESDESLFHSGKRRFANLTRRQDEMID